MFSGIIDHQASIITLQKTDKKLTLVIKTEFDDVVIGESIAVDGVCLTVTDYQQRAFTCELSPETLKLTIAKHYTEGSQVNLERALCLGDRIGGHFVTGHVDQLAEVHEMVSHGDFIELKLTQLHPKNAVYLIQKGSIAVNGVSLTINKVLKNGVSLMLIPHTLGRTNLSKLKKNDPVNIEYDQTAKLIANQLETYLPMFTKMHENGHILQ